jgi:hypothetical protein
MVVIDATMLLLLLRPGTKAPTDASGVPIEKPKERIELLIQRLQKEKAKIVIPTPALSETLIRAGTEASVQIVEYINKYAVFRVEAFDARAAIELATISREALGRKGKRGGSTAVWAKVKFDRQIVAIAKVVGATEIYSDDGDIATLAKQANIEAIGLADLPLPAEDAQFSLDLEGHADAGAIPPQDDEETREKRGDAPPP